MKAYITVGIPASVKQLGLVKWLNKVIVISTAMTSDLKW